MEFHTNKNFTLTYSNGEINPEKQEILLSKNQHNGIQFFSLGLFEVLALITSFSNNEITYDSCDFNGTKTRFVLTRI
ncbi:hypothetical protein [Tenacibaculum finnmarkense]|uniref:hypothetical protein n=1 Tax=Tenacibaculum finnmarkense TaxID=2781243 RepID=UPI001EFAF4A6|nr:hypothetical protein [Tenacibaculum finnmarkense]